MNKSVNMNKLLEHIEDMLHSLDEDTELKKKVKIHVSNDSSMQVIIHNS